MSFILTIDQQVNCTVAFLDSSGNPAAVDGIPVWSSSDDTIATVTASADGMSADVVSAGIGQAQISVTADADLGSGTQQLIGLLDLQVVGGMAVMVQITAGTPTEKLVVNPLAP